MSPEQARAEEVDPRSDLFSFGVVIYEMATGRQAFTGPSAAVVYDAILNRDPESPMAMNSRIPNQLEHTIRKAIEKDRRLRYQHCSDLRADLERLRRDSLSGRTTFIQTRDVTPVVVREEPAVIVGGRSPKVAFLLGLIPGVGALYNAEYKKAAVHILVFGLLSAMGRIAEDSAFETLFGLASFGFYAYMVFDSYHTAKLNVRRAP
jgi:serine/threonine protein kinase